MAFRLNKLKYFILGLLLSPTVAFGHNIVLHDEGDNQGQFSRLNCLGVGIDCDVKSNSEGTITVNSAINNLGDAIADGEISLGLFELNVTSALVAHDSAALTITNTASHPPSNETSILDLIYSNGSGNSYSTYLRMGFDLDETFPYDFLFNQNEAIFTESLELQAVEGDTFTPEIIFRPFSTPAWNFILDDSEVFSIYTTSAPAGVAQLQIYNQGSGARVDMILSGHLEVGGSTSGQSNINSGLIVNNGSGNASTDDFQAKGDNVDRLLVTDADEDDVEVGGHIETTGTAPSLSSCGTTPSISSTATDIGGKVTVGAGISQTTCTVTFDSAWTNAPSCFCNNETQILPCKAVSTTTTLTLSATTTFDEDVISYGCLGQE